MGRKKQPEITKAAILQAAFRAFAEVGYDRTSVNDLLAVTGLSKGAFYHHFKSKDEVMETLVAGIAARAVAQVAAAIEAAAPDAVSQLEVFMSASRRWRSDNVEALRVMMPLVMRDEHALLRARLEAHTTGPSTALLAGILRRGVEEGRFDVLDPEECARQLLLLAQGVSRDQGAAILRGDTADVLSRANVYLTHVERMVGIDEQTLERPSRRLIARINRALKEAP